MDDPAPGRSGATGTGPGKPLLALALGTAVMTGAFFVHARHATGSHALTAESDAHLLPGLIFVDTQTGTPDGGGIIVTSLETGGAAARNGIAVGDRVLRIDDQPIASLDQAATYLVQHRRPRVVLGLLHGEQRRIVTIDRTDNSR